MKVGIGQDSHKFDFENKEKKLYLGGVLFENETPLLGNSDADVVLHAITNAISGVTCVNILGEKTDKMCKSGVKNSEKYVIEALKFLNTRIVHISVSIEGLSPKINPKIEKMRENIGRILEIPKTAVGITATTGEGLTEFGKGNGISCFAIITVE
ncbi:MAG: 2-C-methyl-D-erythritol 2,4-cyclodiphosphate synthase [Clostridia bacterium]|nr:2-C-methyl-D-erythritol 2,4-cyclodiphosphate synthase [Clostridia bacterium]